MEETWGSSILAVPGTVWGVVRARGYPKDRYTLFFIRV